MNWGIFQSVWDNIKSEGKALSRWWTVKADVVFIPQPLRQYITDHELKDTPHGLYFGNVEVISKKGVRALVDGLDECHASFAPCTDEGCVRLELWSMGRRCVRAKMYGSPLRRQGRSLSLDPGWEGF